MRKIVALFEILGFRPLVLIRVVSQGTSCVEEEHAKGRNEEEMKDSYFGGGIKSITFSEGAQPSSVPLSDRSSRKIKTLARCTEKI
jgi:hypothetical protein